MTRLALVATLLFVFTDGTAPASAQTGQAPAATAMVARVHGDVRVRSRAGRRPARLFDRLHDGDTIQTGAGADIVLVFRSGARMRLGGSSEARVRADSLATRKGSADALPSIPTVPLVPPVAGAGTAVTAVRIRAGSLRATEPSPGETVLAEAVVLAFTPAGAESYDVEIAGPDAATVFRTRTPAARVLVPSRVLEPGMTYQWEVRARWPTGFEARTAGAFVTLAASAAAQRAALHAALPDSDPESAMLLAEVDYSLGLWRQALDRFRTAQAAGPVDAVIGERVAALEQRLRPATDGVAP